MSKLRDEITKILYTNSHDDSEGLCIRFERIQHVIDQLCNVIPPHDTTEDTITVDELIEQLKEYKGDQPVIISGVGVCANDSWDAPMYFGKDTVDEHEGTVRINFSTVG